MDFVDKINFIEKLKVSKESFKNLIPNLDSVNLDGEYFNSTDGIAKVTLVTREELDDDLIQNIISNLSNQFNTAVFSIKDINQFNRYSKVSLEI